MRKRVRIALAVLLVVLVSGIVLQVLQPREPVYQGKPLSFWLLYGSLQAKDDAVRQAGTNAIPTLLRMLRAKDSALKVKLMDLTSRQHIIKIHVTKALALNIVAVHGFAALGATAKSAVPAVIEILNDDVSSKGRFDLIIVDYQMPGMNGDILAAAIKALDPNQPIVLMTAYAESLQSLSTPLVGVDLVISKPFDLQRLRQAVTQLLTKP